MNKQIVLMIDDEENVLSALRRLLRKEPYTLATTSNPEDALRFVERVRVSLVITDQRMDGTTGDEVISQIRRKCPDVKFIKLTGYCDGSDIVPKNGAFEVVPKPWNDAELKRLIRDALEIPHSEEIFIGPTKQEEI